MVTFPDLSESLWTFALYPSASPNATDRYFLSPVRQPV